MEIQNLLKLAGPQFTKSTKRTLLLAFFIFVCGVYISKPFNQTRQPPSQFSATLMHTSSLSAKDPSGTLIIVSK